VRKVSASLSNIIGWPILSVSGHRPFSQLQEPHSTILHGETSMPETGYARMVHKQRVAWGGPAKSGEDRPNPY
jgi:hypothetical protein